MKRTILLLILLIVPLVSGCLFTRTVYVPDGTPVRLRAQIKDAPIWALDENGKPVAGTMTLPEGWFCLPHDRKGGNDGQ